MDPPVPSQEICLDTDRWDISFTYTDGCVDVSPYHRLCPMMTEDVLSSRDFDPSFRFSCHRWWIEKCA